MKKFKIPLIIFLLVFILLGFVQLKLERPIILSERFWAGAGWIEIFFVALYGAFVGYKMKDPAKVPYWRKMTWTIFSVVFFTQLILGLSGFEKFLMTGKLHLPIPMMIIGGPVYRGELSVMTILFVSTVLLTGPAWCSHFCYFGAFDSLAASGKTRKARIENRWAIKATILFIVVLVALLLRWLNFSLLFATVVAITFGVIGIILMLIFSVRLGKMAHCILWCPVGTVINFFRFVNPFRMYIDNSCTLCSHCTRYCKYDALNITDIRSGKPALSCTLCGDCLAGCHHNSIKYSFAGLSSEAARDLYLILTVSVHAACLAMARI